MKVSKRSKPFLFSILLIAVVVLPLTVYLLQKEQVFQNFAWFTEQSAVSECSSSTGTAVINATFSNTESSTQKNMNVVVNDLQTGTFVNMGTVAAGASKTVTIDTKKTSIQSGTVIFNLTWTSGTSGTDSRSATYEAVNNCAGPTPTPTASVCSPTQGLCEWDSLAGATGYNVVVKETDTGAVVQTTSTAANATQISFPMTTGTPYQCTVTATDDCSSATPSSSTPVTCTASPTPTPTTPVLSPSPTPVISPSSTPALSPSPTPAISPSSTPALSPSPTPIPTATPVPTSTPIPTPTPAVTITVLTQPPQQYVTTIPGQTNTIVQTLPGQTQTEVVQGPNQTNVVVQPGQTQTVVVTRPPTPTMPPTGSTTPTLILMGTSTLLLLAGGLIFFIL